MLALNFSVSDFYPYWLYLAANLQTKAFLVHFTRAVYAMNWFNIAPGLYYIAADFQVKIATLGILTSAFYVGVAIFQLPAGTLASRYGNRLVGGIGIVILGIAALASGFSFNILFLGTMRFLEGLGSALFFSPAISTLKTVVSEESYSFHINIYNGAFNVGAGSGVVIWDFIDIWLGWRTGFLIGGSITLVTGLVYLIGLRGIEETTRRGLDLLKNLGRVMRFRPIWILSFAGMATMISEIVVGQLSVYYLETSFHFTEIQAMMADALFLLLGFVGGIFGAFMARRYGVSRKIFAAVNIVLALLVIPFAYVNSAIFIYLLAIILGIVTVQAFSMIYVMIGVSQKDRSMVAFSLSLVNFIQQGFGALWPTVFGFLHNSFNYTVAWVSLGAIGILFVPLLFFYNPRSSLRSAQPN